MLNEKMYFLAELRVFTRNKDSSLLNQKEIAENLHEFFKDRGWVGTISFNSVSPLLVVIELG